MSPLVIELNLSKLTKFSSFLPGEEVIRLNQVICYSCICKIFVIFQTFIELLYYYCCLDKDRGWGAKDTFF
jgi:hypothetical protein